MIGALEIEVALGIFAGAICHWFLNAWKDHRITEIEIKNLPTILVMVFCVFFITVFDDPVNAFLAGYFIDSGFKKAFEIYRGINGGGSGNID